MGVDRSLVLHESRPREVGALMSRTFLRAMATGAASIMLAGGAMLTAAGAAEAAPAPTSTTADHQPGRGHDDHGRGHGDDHGRGHGDDHGRGGGRHDGRHDDHRHCDWRSGHWTWNWTWRNHHRVQVRQWHPGFRDCRHEPHRRG